MINGVPNPAHATAQPAARSGAPSAREGRTPDERSGQADAVELSPAARERLERDESAPIRSQLVERVRAQIASGSYLTDEKVDAAVERIQQELFVTA